MKSCHQRVTPCRTADPNQPYGKLRTKRFSDMPPRSVGGRGWHTGRSKKIPIVKNYQTAASYYTSMFFRVVWPNRTIQNPLLETTRNPNTCLNNKMLIGSKQQIHSLLILIHSKHFLSE